MSEVRPNRRSNVGGREVARQVPFDGAGTSARLHPIVTRGGCTAGHRAGEQWTNDIVERFLQRPVSVVGVNFCGPRFFVRPGTRCARRGSAGCAVPVRLFSASLDGVQAAVPGDCAGGRTVKTQRDVLRWQVLAMAIGLFPSGRVAATELSSDYSMARVLYEGRRYSEAQDVFRRLAEDQPESVDLNFYLGRLALWFDDETAACNYLGKAARLAPDNARVQNALGDAFGLMAQKAGLLAKLGWARKCLAAYERAVSLDPLKPAYRWSLLGFYCVAPRLAGGGREKAAVQADAIRKIDSIEGRIAWATVYLSDHRPAAAFSQFDDLLKENENHFLALYHVGRCAALSGEQLERGRVALQRCLQLTPPGGDGMPTLASTHHRLGNILEKLGERNGAAEHYAAALKIHPDYRAEKDALRN